jgi:hypothetical protein
MAIDSADKRASCLGVAQAAIFTAPTPDGSLAAQADRQHVGRAYRGIDATSTAEVTYRPMQFMVC